MPNLVARKIWAGRASRQSPVWKITMTEGKSQATHLLSLACTLKPPPEELLAVSIQGSRVPVSTAQLVGAIEESKTLLIRRRGAVEGLMRLSAVHPLPRVLDLP